MKKNLKKLKINKSTLSNLEQKNVEAGIMVYSIGVHCSIANSCKRKIDWCQTDESCQHGCANHSRQICA